MITNSLRRVLIFGNLYLLVYAVLAVYFFKERIFLDGSYYFFHVVQYETFHVEHQRFILVISQLLAVTGTKLHLSLNAVMILNSFNPVLYLWILFLLSIFWLKHEGIAWAMLLSSVCGIYFIWFIPMYEVWYGCVLLIFFAGVLERKFYFTMAKQILFAILLITLLFSYPLIFIGVIYFSASHFIRERKIPIRIAVIYFLSFTLWLVWKYFFISGYESGKIEYPVSQVGNTVHQNFESLADFKNLFGFLFGIYPEEMMCLLVTLVFLFRKKEKLQGFLLVAVVIAFLLLISLTHQQPWRHSNYFERMYLLLIPLCFVPFLQNIFLPSKKKFFVELLLMAIVLFRLNQIVQHAKDYTDHLTEVQSLIEKAKKNPGSKFTVDFTKHPELISLDEWSLPMESLIFSSLKNNQHSFTISWKADIENPDNTKRLDDTKFRLRLNEIFPDDWLNQNYFHLEHGGYKELSW
ncbi:MAG TPA: hypothetical protein VE978_01150 [Chitinophagales bacterium]|nr:hypothetical protein [Chitinophagales bacterium]